MGFWEILHPGRRTQYQPVAARVVVLQEGARDSGVGLRDLQSLAPNPESRAPRMEARGIEPQGSANRKCLNAQHAQIQPLGPGSPPARCAFSALGASGKAQLRHGLWGSVGQKLVELARPRRDQPAEPAGRVHELALQGNAQARSHLLRFGGATRNDQHFSVDPQPTAFEPHSVDPRRTAFEPQLQEVLLRTTPTNYENPGHFRNDTAQFLQMGFRKFKFILRLHRQGDCRIRMVSVEPARVGSHKVLTWAQYQIP